MTHDSLSLPLPPLLSPPFSPPPPLLSPPLLPLSLLSLTFSLPPPPTSAFSPVIHTLLPCFLCSQGVMSCLWFHNRSSHGSLVSLSLRLGVVCEANEENCQSLKCIKGRERLEMKFKRKILSEPSGILQADGFIIL